MAARSILFALLVAAAVCVAAAEEDAGDVVELTASTYDDSSDPNQPTYFQVNDGSVWFIKYFAPWCGHCRRLEPTWKELATDVKELGNIKIGRVDCTQDRDICTGAEVKGYPTLKVLHKGEEITAYRGARELDALKSFIKEQAEKVLSETTE
eukprot:gene6857-7073_t